MHGSAYRATNSLIPYAVVKEGPNVGSQKKSLTVLGYWHSPPYMQSRSWLSFHLINACEPDLRRIVMAGLLTDVRSGKAHIVTSKADKPRYVPLNAEGKAAFEHWTAGMLLGAPYLLSDRW
jgi:hypothetical protein